MSIVTKTGDAGTTGLYGVTRVPKDDVRIEAIGTVDELNALLGILEAEDHMPEMIRAGVLRVQHQLFMLGADLATPLEASAMSKRITQRHVQDIETWITSLEQDLPQLEWFILPGGSRAAAALHHARTVCRRAERRIITLARTTTINPQAAIFLNRISDLLYLLARVANRELRHEDVRVMYE